MEGKWKDEVEATRALKIGRLLQIKFRIYPDLFTIIFSLTYMSFLAFVIDKSVGSCGILWKE